MIVLYPMMNILRLAVEPSWRSSAIIDWGSSQIWYTMISRLVEAPTWNRNHQPEFFGNPYIYIYIYIDGKNHGFRLRFSLKPIHWLNSLENLPTTNWYNFQPIEKNKKSLENSPVFGEFGLVIYHHLAIIIFIILGWWTHLWTCATPDLRPWLEISHFSVVRSWPFFFSAKSLDQRPRMGRTATSHPPAMNHWIGLRENLNRKPMVFTIKYGFFL